MNDATISVLTVLIFEPVLIVLLGLYIAANRTLEADLKKLNNCREATSEKLNICLKLTKNLIISLWQLPGYLLDIVRVICYNVLSFVWYAATVPLRRIKRAVPHFREGLKILLLGDDRYIVISPYELKSANPSTDPAPQVEGKNNKLRSTTKSKSRKQNKKPELLSLETKEKLPKLSNDPRDLRDVNYLRNYSKELQQALAQQHIKMNIKVNCSATVLLERLNKILATL